MKNKFSILSLALSFSIFTSCSSDVCVKCTKVLPNSEAEAEICQSGPDINVNTKIIGIISDSTISNTTILSYQQKLEAQGYTCK
jgi:hypothetical protein